MSGWNAETQAAYKAAPVTEQRLALAHYWRLRCTPEYKHVPQPPEDEPLTLLLDKAERAHRDWNKYCRGGNHD